MTKRKPKPAPAAPQKPAAVDRPPQHSAAAPGPLSIKLDPRNANTHDDASQAAIGSSLDAFGVGRSVVVDNSGTLIAGNGVFAEAERRGIKPRFVHTTGDELVVVVRDDLSPDDPRRTGLALGDNQVAKLSAWDATAASQLFASLPADLQGATAFDQSMIDQMLADQAGSPTDTDDEPAADPKAVDVGDLTYRVIVKVADEHAQADLIERLESEGFECLPLMS